MVTDLWFHLTYDSRQCMSCSSQIISEILPEIHTMDKCDFHKPIIHSQFNCLLNVGADVDENIGTLDLYESNQSYGFELGVVKNCTTKLYHKICM